MGMLLYNITIAVDRNCEGEWIEWMKREQIPFIMEAGLFSDSKFYRVVTHDDPESNSYCLQLFTDDIRKLNIFLAGPSVTFMEALQTRYAGRHAAFMTLLESCQ